MSNDFMMETKGFADGYIHIDRIGLLITLCNTKYVNKDIYSVQRLVSWQYLYRMPLTHRNMAMLSLLNDLYDEYDFLNGKVRKNDD